MAMTAHLPVAAGLELPALFGVWTGLELPAEQGSPLAQPGKTVPSRGAPAGAAPSSRTVTRNHCGSPMTRTTTVVASTACRMALVSDSWTMR